MPEYIDRKKIRYHFEVGEDTAIEGRSVAYKTMIDSMPTEDVVPVVRCKDCKHYRDSTQAKGIKKCAYSSTNETDFLVMPDDFCNYGERKDSNG